MTKVIRAALAVGVIASVAIFGVASAAAASVASTRSPESRGPRLPIVNGRTITQVKATGTKGPAGNSINTKASCVEDADFINATITAGLEALYAGNMTTAAKKFGEAGRLLEQSEREGICTIE